MHELFPEARLYGTQRHLDRFPELHWEEAQAKIRNFMSGTATISILPSREAWTSFLPMKTCTLPPSWLITAHQAPFTLTILWALRGRYHC